MISNSQRLAQIEIGSELGRFECVGTAVGRNDDVSGSEGAQTIPCESTANTNLRVQNHVFSIGVVALSRDRYARSRDFIYGVSE